MNTYQVTFDAEVSVTIHAETEEEAEQEARNRVRECLDLDVLPSNSFDIDLLVEQDGDDD